MSAGFPRGIAAPSGVDYTMCSTGFTWWTNATLCRVDEALHLPMQRQAELYDNDDLTSNEP